jgi:PleD family two-component response regulator
MLSLAGNFRRIRTHDLGATLSVTIDRLDFRSALVIEESVVMRSSIVQLLKRRGWIAHGIKVASQAFPLLNCIPYHLIVIDGNTSNVSAFNFARTLHNSDEWNKIPLVIITDSPNESLASNLIEVGVYSAKRSTWVSDLSMILAEVEIHGHWKRQACGN